MYIFVYSLTEIEEMFTEVCYYFFKICDLFIENRDGVMVRLKFVRKLQLKFSLGSFDYFVTPEFNAEFRQLSFFESTSSGLKERYLGTLLRVRSNINPFFFSLVF